VPAIKGRLGQGQLAGNHAATDRQRWLGEPERAGQPGDARIGPVGAELQLPFGMTVIEHGPHGRALATSGPPAVSCYFMTRQVQRHPRQCFRVGEPVATARDSGGAPG